MSANANQMSKVKVLINRNSIKKNPDYLRDSNIILPGKREFLFSGKIKNIPKSMKENKDYVLTEWDSEGDFKGVLFTEHFFILIQETKLFSTQIKNNLIKVETLSENDEYLFEYENTPIKCKNCDKNTGFNDLIIDFSDDEIMIKCNHCNETNDFEEFEVEKIFEVMK